MAARSAIEPWPGFETVSKHGSRILDEDFARFLQSTFFLVELRKALLAGCGWGYLIEIRCLFLFKHKSPTRLRSHLTVPEETSCCKCRMFHLSRVSK